MNETSSSALLLEPKKSMGVARALLTGHLVITVPVTAVVLGFTAAGFTAAPAILALLSFPSSAYRYIVFAFLLFGVLLGWLWWSFTIPGWRRWAYRKGVPADQLQKYGFMTGLVWPKGWIFEKTEFKLAEYSFTIPGFEDHQFTLQVGDFFSAPWLLMDGEPAPKGRKRNTYILQRADGREMVVQLRTVNPIDPVPQVLIDGQKVEIAPPLMWYEWIWAGLPLLLVFVGGFLGGLSGGIGMIFNGRLFRSGWNVGVKFLLAGMVSLLAVGSYFALAAGFQVAIHGLPKTTTEIRSEQGRFSITSPIPLQEYTKTLDTPSGPLEVYTLGGEVGLNAFVIMYSDHPMEVIQQQGADRTLDASRDGGSRKLISEKKISLGDYPGREWLTEFPPKNGQERILRERIFLVENRLYQVMAVVALGHEADAEIENFFNSFKLLP